MKAVNIPLSITPRLLLPLLFSVVTAAGSIVQTQRLELPKGDYRFAEFNDHIVALDRDSGVLYDSDASLTKFTEKLVITSEVWFGGDLFTTSTSVVVSSDLWGVIYVSSDLVHWETIPIPAAANGLVEHDAAFYMGTHAGVYRKGDLLDGEPWELVSDGSVWWLRSCGDRLVTLGWDSTDQKATARIFFNGVWEEYSRDDRPGAALTMDVSYFKDKWYWALGGFGEYYASSNTWSGNSREPLEEFDLWNWGFMRILEGDDFILFQDAAVELMDHHWQFQQESLPMGTLYTGNDVLVIGYPEDLEWAPYLLQILEMDADLGFILEGIDDGLFLLTIPRQLIDDYLPDWHLSVTYTDGDIYARGFGRISRMDGDWFHSENHGWLYRYGNGWYYDTHLGAIYYDPKSAPAYSSFVYSLGEEQWYRYLEGTNAPRWMWSYGSREWVSVPRSFE